MKQLYSKFKVWLVLGLFFQSLVCLAQQADETAVPTPDQPPVAVDRDQSQTPAEDDSRRKHIGEVFRFGTDAFIKENEEASSVVVIFGDATVDGKVHDLVVVGGKVKVNGTVGDLVVPLGSAELGPKAHVQRDVVIVGGSLQADPDATMDRSPVEISWTKMEEKLPPLTGLRKWIFQGLVLARPLPHQFGWWWWVAAVCALIYILTAVIFTRPITASVAALESQPVGSFFVGVLTFILFGPLLLLLLATVVGMVIIPFVFCGAIVAFLFGKVAVYRFVGQQVGKQFGVSALQLPLVALLIGIALFYLLYMVPVLGFLVWGIVAPLGFGAVMLAFFRAFRSERSSVKTNGNPVGAAAGASVPPVIPGEATSLSPMDVALLPRAGFWIRFAATFLDLLLVGAVSSVIGLPFFFLLAWVGYHIGMWAWKGTTIGGVVFGIKIFRRDGRPVDFAVALVRSLASFFSALVLFFGFFWAGWNREKLSWHDMIAGTVVVKMPKGVSLL